MLIDVKKIHTYYGKSHILHGVSMQLQKGELACLLGRNGVGKTTTLKSIMGLAHPAEGNILFNGQELVGKEPYEIARLGVGIVPEERRIFGSLSVHENLLMGIKPGKTKSSIEEGWTVDKIYELFPKLKERQNNKGKHLSGGEQQMLAIGRSLMSSPRILLLDEPSLGLAPILVKQIFDIIREINQQGTSILLIEQNAHKALSIAGRGYVLENGLISTSGSASQLKSDEKIKEAYLGGSAIKRLNMKSKTLAGRSQ